MEALNLPFLVPEPLPDEDDLEVEVIVRSRKHDCHTAYRLSKHEIENDYIFQIIRNMGYRLMYFIQEKENAASEGKESQDAKRLQ